MQMSYIVQRNSRFYVVAYNGHDPITGRERRRWHPAGTDHADGIALQRRIERQRAIPTRGLSTGKFMTTTWLATKGGLTQHTTPRLISTPATPTSSPTAVDAGRDARQRPCSRSTE